MSRNEKLAKFIAEQRKFYCTYSRSLCLHCEHNGIYSWEPGYYCRKDYDTFITIRRDGQPVLQCKHYQPVDLDG